MRDFAGARARFRISSIVFVFISVFWAAGCTTGAGVGVGFLTASDPQDQAAKPTPDVQPEQQAMQILEGLDAIDSQLAANRKSVNGIMLTAFSQVGNAYRRGGTTPETGFDCSGFVGWVYGQNDIRLPRSSGDMMAALDSPVSRQDLRPGDLVFFGRKKRITHVGIYTGDNKYIHSPSSGKQIQESSLDDRGRGEYYAGARRIINNEGITAIDQALKNAWVTQTRRQLVAGKTFSETVAALKTAEAQRNPGLYAAESPTPGLQAPGLQVAEAQPTLAASSGDRFAAASPVMEMAATASSQVDLGLGTVVETAETSSIITLAADTVVVESAASAPAALAVPVEADPGGAQAPVAQPAAAAKADAQPAAATQAAAKAEAKPAAAKGSQKSAQAAAQRNARKHKVASGDTLFALARKYGVTIDALAKANNMDKNKTPLKLGQMLVVPPKTRAN